MRVIGSLDDVCALLASRGVPLQRDEANSAVEFATRIRNEPHTAAIVWDPRATLMQVIQPLAIPVPPDRLGAMALALAHVNHALVLPGFCLDVANGRLYFRWVVTRGPDGLTEHALDQAIRAVLESCRDFLIPLRGVAEGRLQPEGVMAEAVRLRDLPPATA